MNFELPVTIAQRETEVLRPNMLIATSSTSLMARLKLFLAADRGTTLIELLVVMAILGVVLTGLADGFASASKAEVDQTSRASDEQSARQALDRLREDIHCASSASQPQVTLDGLGNPNGYLIQFNESPGQCLGVTANSSAVQWCTRVQGTNTLRYALYRDTSACDGIGSTFETDYLTTANPWTVPTCQPGRYQVVQIDLNVNRDPVKRATRTYELKDAIAMRNALTTC